MGVVVNSIHTIHTFNFKVDCNTNQAFRLTIKLKKIMQRMRRAEFMGQPASGRSEKSIEPFSNAVDTLPRLTFTRRRREVKQLFMEYFRLNTWFKKLLRILGTSGTVLQNTLSRLPGAHKKTCFATSQFQEIEIETERKKVQNLSPEQYCPSSFPDLILLYSEGDHEMQQLAGEVIEWGTYENQVVLNDPSSTDISLGYPGDGLTDELDVQCYVPWTSSDNPNVATYDIKIRYPRDIYLDIQLDVDWTILRRLKTTNFEFLKSMMFCISRESNPDFFGGNRVRYQHATLDR
ncbi:hypothetical protein DAPPUDRAFT_264763 [Daphnia pulex]|uniref:Uncharacterized protein n=1 Tax=Daphnia pulex TaxID=6669 RepID=E9HSA3_DAPPU|nr:hypothetical protein DAPPUDRAFT_264763 [Daphnia pulex]|eukprot:EFX65371.1 hypothetical protein DAPPUDRAFT_264763 [Daphnia pulex]